MNDTPTPRVDAQTFDPYPWNQNGPGRSHRPEVMYPCDDGEWVSADLARDLERQLAEATREIEVLRRYGNKDCTAMADEELASIRQPLPNPPTEKP